jgi:F0F1-type ATP synthase epsilon subunit
VAESRLVLEVRTPRESVVELEVRSLRVPADTGQVGLRPRCEPTVLAVEPGLLLAWTAEGPHFVATAGGLLRCDGRRAVVLTPVGVAGRDPDGVRAGLEAALREPRADLALRGAIERLQTGILRELRDGEPAGPPETLR